MIETTTIKPKRDPEVETSLLPDGHIVLVSSKTEWAHTLTPLAALVWEFCDGNNSVPEIFKAIKSIEEITVTDTLETEIAALIEELTDAGFLA